jgi:hypothetical protein
LLAPTVRRSRAAAQSGARKPGSLVHRFRRWRQGNLPSVQAHRPDRGGHAHPLGG